MLRNGGRTLALLGPLGLVRELRVSLRRRVTDSHPSFREPLDLFVQPEIVGLFGGKAAIDLQAFLRVPLRDVELRQHLTIGDVPGALQHQRTSCAGFLTFFLMIRRPPRSALLPYPTLFRSLGLVRELRVSLRRRVTDSHPSFREPLDLFVQ